MGGKKYPPAPIKGWMPKGPDYSRKWQGWKVYADNETGDMVPVIIKADETRRTHNGSGQERAG